MTADLEEPDVADTIVESLLFTLDPGEAGSLRTTAIVALLDARQKTALTHYLRYVSQREPGLYDGECSRIAAMLAG